MEAKEIAFWASEMVQELSRLGDYSVEAKAIRETLELVRDLGVSYHHPLPVPPFTEGWSLAPRVELGAVAAHAAAGVATARRCAPFAWSTCPF